MKKKNHTYNKTTGTLTGTTHTISNNLWKTGAADLNVADYNTTQVFADNIDYKGIDLEKFIENKIKEALRVIGGEKAVKEYEEYLISKEVVKKLDED